MSTRAQIKLRTSDETTNTIYIYKHSDGYPSDVLPVLVPFTQDFFKSRGVDQAYFLCQLVRAFAFRDAENAAKNPERFSFMTTGSYKYLGWGLDTCLHGDIDFLYEIDDSGKIFINNKEMSEIELKKLMKE
jgi:hypothetical protein